MKESDVSVLMGTNPTLEQGNARGTPDVIGVLRPSTLPFLPLRTIPLCTYSFWRQATRFSRPLQERIARPPCLCDLLRQDNALGLAFLGEGVRIGNMRDSSAVNAFFRV
jgi:hypothetical protein